MVKIEFYYKSADKDKTEAMREAIDIALLVLMFNVILKIFLTILFLKI